MTVIEFFHSLLQSAYSLGFYRMVARWWQGSGIRFSLLVMLLSLAPALITYEAMLYSLDLRHAPASLEEELDANARGRVTLWMRQLIAQLPDITVEQGNIKISEKEPYIITYPDSSVPFIVFDDKANFSDRAYRQAWAIVTHNGVLLNSYNGNITRYAVKVDSPHYVITQEKLVDWLENNKGLVALFIPIGLAVNQLGPYAVFLLRSLVFAGIAMLFRSSLLPNFSFNTLLRLAVVSGTPSLMVQGIAYVIPIPFYEALYFLLAVAYFIFSLAANRIAPLDARIQENK